MSKTPDLETLLRRAPRPEVPQNLLATLEKQMEQALLPQGEPQARVRLSWRRFWLPLAGLASAVVLFVAMLALISASTAPSFADSLRLLTEVKSLHVVWRYRNDPKDPFLTTEFWFREDPGNPRHRQLRTTSAQEDRWRENSRLVIVDRKTGTRRLELTNARFPFAGCGWDLWSIAQGPELRKVRADKVPGLRPGEAKAFWFGECPDGTNNPGRFFRIWVNRTNQLPARIQCWSTAYPQVAPEVLLTECEFSEFNARLPEKLFTFTITDQDLAQLGVTRAELDALGDDVVSFQLTGEVGVEIIGTITDDAGVRQVRGKLPFNVIHTQRGDMKWDFRTQDDAPHGFDVRSGLSWEPLEPPSTGRTSRLSGWTAAGR
jgi:hypothetical protein